MMIWMGSLVFRLRNCVEVVAIGMMPDQIAVNFKLSHVFVEGCACDSCGVFRILRGQIECVSISIRCKVRFCRFVQLDIYIAISDEITYNNIYFSSAKSCESARQGVYFS